MSLLLSHIALYMHCARLRHFHSKARAILLCSLADGQRAMVGHMLGVIDPADFIRLRVLCGVLVLPSPPYLSFVSSIPGYFAFFTEYSGKIIKQSFEHHPYFASFKCAEK